MKLEDALVAGGALCKELEKYCDIIQIAGSVRRERPEVRDIDIVVVAKDAESKEKIKQICMNHHPVFEATDKPKSGPALERFYYEDHGVWVDVYYATKESFPIILLIRTGSKEHNIYMCGHAKRQGRKLAADGSGVFADRDGKQKIPVSSEIAIFRAIGLEYKDAPAREVTDA